MAKRYCGLYTVYIHYHESMSISPNGHYTCAIWVRDREALRRKGYKPETKGVLIYKVNVGAPVYLEHAVDSSEAYDSAAHAAMSFAADELGEMPCAEYDAELTGWLIRRKQ